LVAPVGNIGPVLPNLFRGINDVAGVESGADSSPKNSGGHAWTISGAIPATPWEKGDAGDGQRWFLAGVAAGWAGAKCLGRDCGGEERRERCLDF
jgi:hypothetical protein